MARTVDPVAHAVRREAFLDAATKLIQAKGYEQLSIADVIAEVSASKGAFYHYFGSKADLLDGVVLRLVESGTAALEPVAADPTLSAVQKFDAVFEGLAGFKAERKELIFAFLDSWMSEDNAVVREHLRRAAQARMTPLYARIIEQGVTEGTFSTTTPQHTARVVAALLLATNEAVSEQLIAWRSGELPFEQLDSILAAFGEALERVLGVAPGALGFERRSAVLRQWLDEWSGATAHPDPAPHPRRHE